MGYAAGHVMAAVACLLLLDAARLRGDVLWLELGAGAVAPTGGSLRLADLAAAQLRVFDPYGVPVATAETGAVDEVAAGHFKGVVRVADAPATALTFMLFDVATDRVAAVGTATALPDDLEPRIDPDIYAVAAAALVWRARAAHSLQVSVVGRGAVDAADGTYSELDGVTLTATPAPFYEFLRWSGDVPAELTTANPLRLGMGVDRQLTAHFGVVVPSAWWETHFGATPVDLEGDADGDGLTNRQEYERGTDPHDAGSAAEAEVELWPGWNMVAMAVQPLPLSAPEAVLDGLPLAPVWWWDAWQVRLLPATETWAKQGYWVYSAQRWPALRVTGQAVIDDAMRLWSGWNLLGTAVPGRIPATAAVRDMVWYWRGDEQRYEALSPAGVLQLGTAYWLYATVDLELNLTPASR